jgi:hypothetical protein
MGYRFNYMESPEPDFYAVNLEEMTVDYLKSELASRRGKPNPVPLGHCAACTPSLLWRQIS